MLWLNSVYFESQTFVGISDGVHKIYVTTAATFVTYFVYSALYLFSFLYMSVSVTCLLLSLTPAEVYSEQSVSFYLYKTPRE